ncbi:type IV toxin-antitoxin system AbiEi family antitoxin [Derxia lacustris]|uniref:type IV toxin-antitoxin system AbiEi family antitoxin n=1 Tax=Derxia lacustris TaxID=764842 RepID=UPI001593DD47|nr:type IV toxin-antitoxin system AbiEi family antitoxin [Derxia lacustris]
MDYLVHSEAEITPALLVMLHLRTDSTPPDLLIAPQLTATQAARCRELGIQFLDAAGNAYLSAPGLFVFVSGLKAEPKTAARLIKARPAAAGGTGSAMRVVFTLLDRPALLDATYRDIAASAGVSLASIRPALDDLTLRGHLRSIAAGKRRLTQPRRLFEEWEHLWPTRLKPRLKGRRFTASRPDWWRDLDPREHAAQWGGDVAAWHYTHQLKPATVTLYAHPDALADSTRGLARAGLLRADARGEVEILPRFWQLDTLAPASALVPAMLVHAELIATLDPRCLAVAQALYEQEIASAIALA